MTDRKNALNGVHSVVLDLDGTLYDKKGLARRMVRCLWWCLPLLASERLARRNAHYVQFASAEEFYDFFFHTMSRGHWWSASIAAVWYHEVYLPTMIRLIARYCKPREEVMVLVEEALRLWKVRAVHRPMLFDLMVDAPSLGALKPSEPCARRVLELLGAAPETTLFVGDRDDKDGASARAVGAKFFLVS